VNGAGGVKKYDDNVSLRGEISENLTSEADFDEMVQII